MSARWGHLPAPVRRTTAAVTVLFAAAICLYTALPRRGAPSRTAAERLVAVDWSDWSTRLERRAAIDFQDDFRNGLQDWRGRSNTPAQWPYDAVGFVLPGSLALYRPTLPLTDYRLEFQAQLDRQAFGFVFRAADCDNYYAVKFVIAQPGPLPRVEVVRYAVVHGREGTHTVHPLPLVVRADTTYQVRMEVRGSDFTLITQGKVADQWSDSRLSRGGVGFFCGKGERASLRWVEVSHQYDALGKLCAYLAPPRPR